MIKKIFLLFLFGYVSIGFSQEDGTYYVSRDLSTWTTLSAKMKLSSNWSFSLSEQLRLKTNSSELDLFLTQLESKYKFPNGLYLGAGYRFIGDQTNSSGLDWEQRFQGDLGYEFESNRFDFELRLRGQSKDDLGETRVDDSDYARRALRLKLQTGYDIKKWKFDPIISTEIFRSNGKYENAIFSKFRATIGTNYKFEKAGKVSVFYRFEKDLNTEYGLNQHIIGFQYKFTFKTYNNDEWK